MEISFSNLSIATSFQDIRHDDTAPSQSLPKRTTSLVRPERSRIDPQHPQYHTRRRVIENETSHYYRSAGDRLHPARRSVIRRGLLAREDEEEKGHSNSDSLGIEYTTSMSSSTFDVWKTFCYFVTCCCPPPVLKAMGRCLVCLPLMH